MSIIKSIIVAFSMYSRIPMPRFNWNSKDMKYHLIFFPWVGVVIGALEYGWQKLSYEFNISYIVFTLIALVIPVIVTGGFHVDGYMDTSDALASWGDKEKRLEILKDSHVGAFAVIRLITLGIILFSAIYSMDELGFTAWTFTFFVSRAISGICVIKYKKGKNEGILNTSAQTADEKKVVFFLALQFILWALMAGAFFQFYWTAVLVALVISVVYYVFTAYTKFGGITGDLAGWFVCIAETLMAVAIAIFSKLG